MVSCKLKGNRANQMFQIATTIAYAKRHKLDFAIPAQTEDESKWKHCFKGIFPEIDNSERPTCVVKENSNGSYSHLPHYYSLTLDGYFQDERYFKDYRRDIIKAFNIAPIMPEFMNTISIHVRRGDYLNFPDKHPVVTKEYLKNAIDGFIKIGCYKFMFFSDDIEWCRRFIEKEESLHLMNVDFHYSLNSDPFMDLCWMSSCAGHIISNSSFSWWGSWLSSNPNKIVIAPKVWTNVGKEEWDTENICPKDWIRL